MKLRLLIPNLDKNQLERFGEYEVTGISYNSKTVSKDNMFVAIKGTKFDGNEFVLEALRRGANSIITQEMHKIPDPNNNFALIRVADTRKFLAEVSAKFYGNPSQKLKVVGVTGTNGKTTVTYLLESMFRQAGFGVGLIGTINYKIKNKFIIATNTTPGPLELQSLLSEMVKEELDYCICEVSSHALEQSRVEGIDFSAGVFTNLTGDHLDYHLNLENYFLSKAKLFENLNKDASAIINLDDRYGQRLISLTNAKQMTFGIENNASVKAEDINLSLEGTDFKVCSPSGNVKIKTKLIGRHNVYNILASIATGLARGLDLKSIKLGIEKITQIPGRLERLEFGQPFKVFVDFAHTHDALKNILDTFKQINNTGARIILVFGCGGERDKTKRPKMGMIATDLADFVIITSDNPRGENPEDIVQDIVNGIEKDNYKVVLDRAKAIEEAINLAETNDIVLIAGKGHERYQIFKDSMIPFDDRIQVKNSIEHLKKV